MYAFQATWFMPHQTTHRPTHQGCPALEAEAELHKEPVSTGGGRRDAADVAQRGAVGRRGAPAVGHDSTFPRVRRTPILRRAGPPYTPLLLTSSRLSPNLLTNLWFMSQMVPPQPRGAPTSRTPEVITDSATPQPPTHPQVVLILPLKMISTANPSLFLLGHSPVHKKISVNSKRLIDPTLSSVTPLIKHDGWERRIHRVPSYSASMIT